MTAHISPANIASFGMQITVIVGAGALLLRAFRVDAPGAILAYWRALLLACLMLPLCQPWNRVTLPAGTTAVATVSSTLPTAGVTAATQSLPRGWQGGELLLLVLAAGIAVRVLWLAIGAYRLVASATTLTAARPVAGRYQPRTGARRRWRWLLRVGPGLRSDHVRRDPSRRGPAASHVRDALSRAGGNRVPRASACATPRLAPRNLRGSRRGGAVVPPGRLGADRTHPACARASGGRSHDPVDGLSRALRRVAARGGPRAPLSLVFTGITILAATPAEEARRPHSAGEHHDHSKVDRVTHGQRSRAGSRRDLRGPVVPARSPGSDGDNLRRTDSTGAGRRAPAAR